MHKIEIYTDGSSIIKDKFYESSSAVVIYLDDELIYKGGVYHKNGTNSLGEVYALLLGLCKLKDLITDHEELANSIVHVYADSDYVVRAVTSYIKSWIRQGLDKNWISYSTKHEVAYQSVFKYLWKEFLKPKSKYNLSFYHINSHISKKKKGDSDLIKARFAFMKRNEIEISMDDFKKHSDRNDEVDSYAEAIRVGKIYFIEEGNEEWVNIRKILTRDGTSIIRKRNINKN